jgi:hypothetical protein
MAGALERLRVIPAKAGIQFVSMLFCGLKLDSRLRGKDIVGVARACRRQERQTWHHRMSSAMA